MEHYQQIVIALETARSERGITKSELARRAEMEPRRLMLILEGKRQLRADEFIRVCGVVDIPLNAFEADGQPDLQTQFARKAAERNALSAG